MGTQWALRLRVPFKFFARDFGVAQLHGGAQNTPSSLIRDLKHERSAHASSLSESTTRRQGPLFHAFSHADRIFGKDSALHRSSRVISWLTGNDDRNQ